MRHSTRSPLLTYTLGGLLLILLLGIDMLSAQGLFVALYQTNNLSQPLQHALSSGIGIALVGICCIYIGIYRISESFMLISKYATALSIPLFLASLVSLGGVLSPETILAIILLLLSLSSFLSSYQQEEHPHLYLRIGLLLWGLCYISSLYILFIPLWLYSSYVQKSNSPRNILALLTGLLTPSSITLAYGLYKYNPSGLITTLKQYTVSLTRLSPISLSTPYEWGIVAIGALGFAILLSYNTGVQSESIRQRAQGGMLVVWSMYGLITLALYSQSPMLYLPLLSLSLLGARGLDLLKPKSLRIVLSLISIVFVLMSVLI